VIGGGVIGLATAHALVRRNGTSIAVLEAESGLARHQSGHNSGVIHSGLYYKPGSLKARNCTEGRDAMYRFCAEHGIPHERCGKVVVAVDPSELPRLDELERRGRANGLTGIERLDAPGLRKYEPHLPGVAGLHVPHTGIVDYTRVASVLADRLRARDVTLLTGARVTSVRASHSGFVLGTPAGEIEAANLINCAGLQSDRVAGLCGLRPTLRIVPFRGEYYTLRDERRSLVRNLIYPVPDPRFPFLGVHLTRRIGGEIEAGPNAVLALKREGYRRFSFGLRDALGVLSYPGFWRMAARHWRTAVGELHRSYSKTAFLKALQRLLPDLEPTDLAPGGAGVRAQAVARDGSLVDDFVIQRAERMFHVLNAPSPGATASLSIGQALADDAARLFGLSTRP
jgi:L-2-hydroxyglutarate oxidase